MIAKTAASLFLAVLLALAVFVSRSASLQGIELTTDARIAVGSLIPDGAPIAVGDRVIRAGGFEVRSSTDIDRIVQQSGDAVELRVVSMKDELRREIAAADLQGDVPEVLTPEFYITSIGGQPSFGALLPDVARALTTQGKGSVTVQAVPVKNVFDGTIGVQRGMPPSAVLIGVLIGMCAVLVLWSLSAGLGLVVGLAGAALSFWFVEGLIWARILSLLLMSVSGVVAAWLSIEPVSRMLAQRGRARSHEGANSRPDLLDALTIAEQEFGFPVHVIVGSAQLAIRIERDYERLAVRDADSITTSSLQMLYTEGGVFPRADVGDGVAEMWDDPIHDMDVSTGIACAVPIPRYGTSSDQWAFVVARTKDTPRAMALLEPMIELADMWAHNGVREAIAVYASHSLFRMIREARNTSSVIPPSVVRDEGRTIRRESSAPVPAVERPQTTLDFVSEGVGVPRTVTREELERRRQQQPIAAAEESVGAALKVARPLPSARVAADELERLKEELANVRAWSSHLERHVQDGFPVDDPDALGESDWYEVQHLRKDERPCLILGESGVGKEFISRAMHFHGQRAHRRIATIDCARLPASVAELELFGDAGDGALVDLLEGGSLVLKSPSVLGRGTMDAMFRRVLSRDIRLFICERYSGLESGMPKQIPPSIRAIVDDRYAHLKPLRERPEDIVRYARWFLRQDSMIYGEKVEDIDPAAERLLETMDLPSNFVELRTLIRSAMFRVDDDVLDVRALLGASVGDVPRELARIESDDERQRLVAVLQETEGNKSEAARILGLSRGALLRRLKRHGLM